MKVFISHQKSDTDLAAAVAHRIKNIHNIDSYLDVIDPNASQEDDQLGEYLRMVLGKCTQLMAVVSSSTKSSWWVPWEIGIATEKDYPIATYAGDSTTLPEYLRKWPYLTSMQHVDEYARLSRAAVTSLNSQRTYKSEGAARRSATQEFHRILKATLGQ